MRRRAFGSGERLVQIARCEASATPGKSASRAEQVQDQLEVQVRRPVAVGRRGPHARDRLARLHGLADREAAERVLRQVAVEGVEGRAVARLVPEDDEGSVVLRQGVVRQDVNDPGERGAHRRPRLDEEVDAQVHGTPLVGRASSGREGPRQVDRARLVVASDRDLDARALHLAGDQLGERSRLEPARIGAEEEAAHAEVENEARLPCRVHVQHRRRPDRLEPRDDRGAVRERRQAAGLAKGVVRVAGVHSVQLLERFPGGRLAHRDVGITRRAPRSHGRARHAHREPGAHQGEQEMDLLHLEGEGLVVAGDHRGRGGHRVVLPEQGVGGRHRRLRHEQAVVHVAEVQEPGHRAGMVPRRPHDHVVVVRVAVDHRAPEAGEGGHDLRLVADERPLDEGTARGTLHLVDRTADPGGPGEVPREVGTMGGRVLEVPQGLVHRAEGASQTGEQLGRAGAGVGESRARHPGEREDEARRAVRARGLGQGLTGGGRHDPGHGQVGDALLQVPQGRALQLDQPPVASRVHGLEHEGPTVGRAQAEVVVELPREGLRPGFQAVPDPRQVDRVLLGQRVLVTAGGVHGGDCATLAEPIVATDVRRCRSTGRPMGGGADVRAHRRHGSQ